MLRFPTPLIGMLWTFILSRSICEDSPPFADLEPSIHTDNDDSDPSVVEIEAHFQRRRIKAMNISPRDGSIIWTSSESSNVDIRFEIHGGTISFVDRIQMVRIISYTTG
jgi:hypothetical protein